MWLRTGRDKPEIEREAGVKLACARLTCWVLLVSACVHPVRKRYAKEFDCPVRTTRLEKIGSSGFRVTGCMGEVRYKCVAARRPPGEPYWAACPVEREDVKAVELTQFGQVRRLEAGDGPLVVLQLALDSVARLSLNAAPNRNPDLIEAEITDKRGDRTATQCPLQIMLDGRPSELPEAQSNVDKLRRTWRLSVPKQRLLDMNHAQLVALRACERRWVLGPEQRALLALFTEELALANAQRSIATEAGHAGADGGPDG